jgi:phosphatidylserine/phosphatidylglycerophosphate/cardiolipin synthase-like enzyme
MAAEAEEAVSALQDLGVLVLYTDSLHRKLAVLDREITYEGSLNVLSQGWSSEIMRRIESAELAEQMIRFTKLDKYLS